MPPKNKFYQPSPEKINDIYKLISHQQQTMAELLNKYTDDKDYRTVQSPIYQFSQAYPRGKSQSAKLETITLELPSINPQRKANKKRYKHKGDGSHHFDKRNSREKLKLKDHLQRAYGTDRPKINRSRAKLQPQKPNQINPTKKHQQQKSSQGNNQSIVQGKQLPIPLGYLKDNIESDNSSEQGEVPLTYYQKQYKAVIRQQSLEQTNFLYFSKNQSIKDWTQGLLLLFEKHDKELQSLRKKCKYLQKFDYNFFSIDIFKEN